MDISHIIGIIAIGVILGCILFTVINKKNHPERYKNEKGNVFNILFGGMIDDFKENPNDFYYKNSDHDRKHMYSMTDQFKKANEKRNASMKQYLNNDTNINNNDKIN